MIVRLEWGRRRPTGYVSQYGWRMLRDTMRSERAFGWRRDPLLVRIAIGPRIPLLSTIGLWPMPRGWRSRWFTIRKWRAR